MAKDKEVLNIDDSVTYCRGNFAALFPVEEGRRKVLGNLPARLHDQVMKEADKRNVRAYEFLAGLMDFYTQYEAEFKTELAVQRKSLKR